MYRIVLICMISILSEELAPIKAKIIQPEEKYLFLNPGDKLQIVCERYDELKQVSWTKQEFGQEEFQKIDTSGPSGYYTVAFKENGTLVSKFLKDRVTSADSGTYRCQGEDVLADSVTVKVIEVTTRNGLVEKFAGNETQMECFGRDHLNTSFTTKWFKRGIPDVLHVGDQFHFRKPGLYDIGVYECLISDEAGRNTTRVVNLFSYPYVKIFEKSKNIIEGETLKLNCAAYGWPTPGVTWYRNGQLLDPEVDARVSFPNGTSVFQSLIIVDRMELTDRAEYTCVATTDRYPGVTYNTTVLVRVKGRFAALWPFIGICFEVIVLCIIIVVYERRRSKRADEDDAIVEINNKDNAETNCNSTEESLRQRKQ